MSLATGNNNRLNRPNRPNRPSAQVFLEYAISLVGVVSLIFVLLKVWNWVNTTMILRQQSFQDTRIEAGTREGEPGKLVPYQPAKDTPLILIGAPGFTTGNPPTGPLTMPPATQWCDAGDEFFEEAQRLRAEADGLRAQQKALTDSDNGRCAMVPDGETTWDDWGCTTDRVEEMEQLEDDIAQKEIEITNKETEINNAQDELDHINLVELPEIDRQIQDWQDALADEVDPAAIDFINNEIARLNGIREGLVERRDDLDHVLLPDLWRQKSELEGQKAALEAELTALVDAVTDDAQELARLGEEARLKDDQANALIELGLQACGLKPTPEP
ncbi:MAG: hypothetical protein COV75_03100 [Candidatus Omnitrophica bacterium CG11_big_fil_rev_8_21_14_0_20_63_9]|nr:MAG: hypothetical protein COV75_03100 [Candidatus Omnitrophica bacterium CG11_big_fil_rev_8_21_14_0_20_63_9]